MQMFGTFLGHPIYKITGQQVTLWDLIWHVTFCSYGFFQKSYTYPFYEVKTQISLLGSGMSAGCTASPTVAGAGDG